LQVTLRHAGASVPKDKAVHVAVEAKHLRPRLDRVSLRPDARDAFATALRRRLTVVCAPAGYGKTTTTAAALERRGSAVAWCKIDVLDHDPVAFLASMVRTVRHVDPEFGGALLHELENGPVSELSVEQLAAHFVAECDRTVTDDRHLVLDDYHEAVDAVAMNGVLGYLLENCPPAMHFVVLTRYEPAFPLEKLRLQGELAWIGGDILRFDADQVSEVLALRSGRTPDPIHVRRLHALTEGWPASVVLAGMALVWLDADSLEDALADPRLRTDAFSYLAEQVFRRQSPEVRRFLLRTCCLEHVTAGLGERLTMTGDAHRHLQFLARNHVFTFDTGTSGAYRYHNLLRDFLRQRFVQDEGEPAFNALQRETAVALEEAGDWTGTVELLLQANEQGLALDVVARGGEAALERSPSEQLRLWLSRLSAGTDRPWRLVLSGVVGARDGRFESALGDLHRAAEALERSSDCAGLYQVLSITEWAEFWSGDSAASVKTCYRALDLAATDGQRLHTLLSLQSAALDMRRWDEVESASARADTLLPQSSPEEAARSRALRAHAAFYRGDMRAARELITRCHSPTQTAAQRAATLNTHGMIDMALGDYDAAAEHLHDAADVAEGFGHALTTYMIEDNIAFLAACTGSERMAIPRLEALLDSDSLREPTLRCFALTHLGTVLRRSGDVGASLAPTGAAIEAVPVERDPYLAHNAAANLAFAEGLRGESRRDTLLELSAQGARAGLRFVELKGLLYAGVLADAEGDRAEAIDLLERCLPPQLELGHINLIAQELCPRAELASAVVRRHRTNGLGPPLLAALSRHWRFNDAVPIIRRECPTGALAWLADLDSAPSGETLETVGPGRRGASPSAVQIGGLTPLDELTARELQVLELMARDFTNGQIAASLFIALSTVKTHVNHVLRKLGQTTRVGAILEFQRLAGLVETPDGPRHLHPPA
jgi:ATP/maltotriose-dependent transcriptional regulator MalT